MRIILRVFFLSWMIIFLFTTPVLPKENKPIESYRIEVMVNAPASFLYPFLIYEDKIIKWNNDTSVNVTFPKGLDPRVGKQIRVELKNVPTQPWMLLEIIQLEKDKRVLTRFIDGVLAGEFEYRLEPVNENQTLLVHEMRIKPVGTLVSLVWEIHGKRVHRNKMQNFLKNIKQVVEKEWALEKNQEAKTVEPKVLQ